MAKARSKPEASYCATCGRREWLALLGHEPTADELRVLELKLRDWLGASRIQSMTCLSVCPDHGLTVSKRGKTRVLSDTELEDVERQFDPTRQLKLFSDSGEESEVDPSATSR